MHYSSILAILPIHILIQSSTKAFCQINKDNKRSSFKKSVQLCFCIINSSRKTHFNVFVVADGVSSMLATDFF